MLRNKTLLAVSLAVCAAYIGIGMVLPVRVLYAESQGASLAIIGAMASAYLISNFIFQYPSGWLADRWGRKPLMLLSLLSQAVLSLLYLFVFDPLLFVVLRFVEGLVAAAFLPSARALITDSIPAEKRGEAFGIFGAFFSTGFLFGPAIGGLLASGGYASAFIAAVVFRVLALVLVFVMIRPGKHQKSQQLEKNHPLQLRKLFVPSLTGAYLLAFGDFLYIGFDTTLAAIWMHDHLGATVAWIGLTYMVWSLPGIILAPIAGRIADRRRRSTMILIFGLAQVPLYIVYALSTHFWLVVLVFLLHGTFYAFIQPAVDSHVASASVSHARARILGIYSAAGLIGGFVGASGLGFLYSWNFRSPLLAIGLGYGLCVCIGGTLIRRAESKNRLFPPANREPRTEEEPVISASY
ncbi:MAG TPA: MFS transporter [Ktedonobacteraceae bacterium]|jgi:MFS family permease